MKKEYDFSEAVRGRFFRGSKPLRIAIEVSDSRSHPRFEVYSDSIGKYRFRLKTDLAVLFTSEEEYATQDECVAVISQLKDDSLVAPTIFA